MSGLTGQEKSRNHRIVVSLIGSGWAALEIADYEDMGWGPDIVQSGIGRYATKAEAIVEAEAWAQAENLPFRGEGI